MTILSPTDGATFRAGDVITFSGTATDAEDGTLPASAYTWNIDFLHDTHVHPGTPITGVTSGTFTIPTAGHDFSDFTRYRVSAHGHRLERAAVEQARSPSSRRRSISLSARRPQGRPCSWMASPTRRRSSTTTSIGFNHTITAPDQTISGTTYNFASWSDGGAQTHTIIVPDAEQTYTANFVADTTAPTVSITAPTGTVSGTVTITANATDNAGVAGVQFQVDNNPLGAEDTTAPYSATLNTTTIANGTHTLTALARDINGNTALSAPVTITVNNAAEARRLLCR